MEGNLKSPVRVAMAEEFSQNRKSLMLFEVTEEFIAQLRTEGVFSIRGSFLSFWPESYY